jgi:putative endonuclease
VKAAPSAARVARGTRARALGHRREWLAALWLMLKGYRILGFRLRAPQAEIDLLAQRGCVLAVVEVKSRATIEAALEAVDGDQRQRLRRAGRALAARRPGLRQMNVRLDLLALAPGRFPRHIPDAWSEDPAG